MRNTFDGIISSGQVEEKNTFEFENISIETSKTEKAKTGVTCVHCEKREKEQEKCLNNNKRISPN